MPIIKVTNLSKRYSINRPAGGYVALRDVITKAGKNPFSFLKAKGRAIAGLDKKEEFWALRDVNFEVEQGDVVGIIGANGAGKSTLLKILSQITPPTEGEIVLHGKIGSLLEVGTGFHPELSGRENAYLNGAILGMSKEEIEAKFDQIVEFSGIGKFIDTPVKYYSSGMYVRLAFSVAAHLEPDILLVDEVLAVGDAEFQKKCLGKMDEVTKKDGRTILFVSHNMGAIKNLCNKCVLLEKGAVATQGDTNEVISYYLNRQSISSGKTIVPTDNEKIVAIETVESLDARGANSGEINIDDPFSVRVTYKIGEDLEKNNYVAISLIDANNNILLQSLDVDMNEAFYDCRGKGRYQSTFVFPPLLLNSQTCRLQVYLGIPPKYNPGGDAKKYFDVNEETQINFHATPNHFSKKFFSGSRNGSFLPLIKSEIKKI